MKYRKIVLLTVTLGCLITVNAHAYSLDFGWGPLYQREEQTLSTSEKGIDLIWYYKIANNNTSRLCTQFEIVLVTDIGHQYEDHFSQRAISKKLLKIDTLQGNIYPGVTKQGVAYFESVDKDAKWFYLFVSGLVLPLKDRCERSQDILRILYKRIGNKWKFVQTDWLR